MNAFILEINKLPFAVWDQIPSTLFSTWLLYVVVIALCVWLMNKNKSAFHLSLICLAGFLMVLARNKWQVLNQQKLIVYNIPQYRAIDLICGNNYLFIGDSSLMNDAMLQNFHLKPGRTLLQLTKRKDILPAVFQKGLFYEFENKRILLIDKPIAFDSLQQKINIDIIIISKNPKLSIPQLASVFNCREYIFDASNSLWKIDKWKKDCELLLLRCYSVPEQGAFIIDGDQ